MTSPNLPVPVTDDTTLGPAMRALANDRQRAFVRFLTLGMTQTRAAAEAGYSSGVTCQRGAATPGFDPLALPRKAISYGDNTAGFLWKLYLKDTPKGEALARPGHAMATA